MHVARFDDVHLIPVRSRRVRAASRPESRSAEELEFSEFGRSPHLSAGWVLLAVLGFWTVVSGLIAVVA